MDRSSATSNALRFSNLSQPRRARCRSGALVACCSGDSAAPDGGSTTTVPANLAVFRVGSDGRLDFVQRHDVAVGRKPLWWMGIVARP